MAGSICLSICAITWVLKAYLEKSVITGRYYRTREDEKIEANKLGLCHAKLSSNLGWLVGDVIELTEMCFLLFNK